MGRFDQLLEDLAALIKIRLANPYAKLAPLLLVGRFIQTRLFNNTIYFFVERYLEFRNDETSFSWSHLYKVLHSLSTG